jgi:transposase-like protein
MLVEISQGKTTVAKASRAFDLSPSEVQGWVDTFLHGLIVLFLEISKLQSIASTVGISWSSSESSSLPEVLGSL